MATIRKRDNRYHVQIRRRGQSIRSVTVKNISIIDWHFVVGQKSDMRILRLITCTMQSIILDFQHVFSTLRRHRMGSCKPSCKRCVKISDN